MAGHTKSEMFYFVPRTLLLLLHSISWYCELLLPHLEAWRQQARSRRGDHSTCCDKFLNHILPYFVETLVQDGIYLIIDFPNHPMSQFLKVRIFFVLIGYCTTMILTVSYYTLCCTYVFYHRTSYLAMSSGLVVVERG
jgi:hypothetical protein